MTVCHLWPALSPIWHAPSSVWDLPWRQWVGFARYADEWLRKRTEQQEGVTRG